MDNVGLNLSILAFIALIVVIVWLWYIVLFASPVPPVPLGGTNLDRSIATELHKQLCPLGHCATSLLTGEKRCPAEGKSEKITVGLEVCNSPELCDNPQTPYAVNRDGSTNDEKVCQKGFICPCVTKPTCADYVTRSFVSLSGTPYNSFENQRTYFTQKPIERSVNLSGEINNTEANNFCSIPMIWANRAGCQNIKTREDAEKCLALNPCQSGTLAYVRKPEDWALTPVSCVRGKPCPTGKIAYWNMDLGAVSCI